MIYRIGVCIAVALLIVAGGPPNPGTPADRRKKVNNPNAGKPKSPKPPTKVTKAVAVKKK